MSKTCLGVRMATCDKVTGGCNTPRYVSASRPHRHAEAGLSRRREYDAVVRAIIEQGRGPGYRSRGGLRRPPPDPNLSQSRAGHTKGPFWPLEHCPRGLSCPCWQRQAPGRGNPSALVPNLCPNPETARTRAGKLSQKPLRQM